MAFIDKFLPAPTDGGFKMDGYWVWCGSVIRGDDNMYHMFASRWPKSLPFAKGYVFASEVVRAVSETPEGPYRFAEVVLSDRGESFWDGRMTHNPAIRKYGDQYVLFYIGATYPGPRPSAVELTTAEHAAERHLSAYSSIRIGLTTAKSLSGPWQRSENPVLEPRPGKWDSTITTNPSPCVMADGSVYLYYRSNTKQGLRLGVAKAESLDAPFHRLCDDPVLVFDDGNWVEDPFVWRTNNRFALIAKDCRGGITGERHAGIYAESEDGINWKLSDPPKAYSRRIRWDNGDITTQGSLERAHLIFDGDTPTHMFAATADGPGGFNAAENSWNMVLPLKHN